MRTIHPSQLDLTQNIFNTTAATTSGLFLVTHSVTVTLIGTVAASLLTGWTMWLPPRRAPR